MKHTLLSILLLAALLAPGCTDDPEETPQPAASVSGGAQFRLAVDAFTAAGGSRASVPSTHPEPESAGERAIHDFWLFQFRPDGTQLAAPVYFAVGETETLSDLCQRAFAALTRNTPMTLYVVTNTGSPAWASGAGFDTLDKVKAEKLPSPYPIRVLADQSRTDDLFIPMSGQLDQITVTDKTLVVVPVTRMYAKLKVKFNFAVSDMVIYDVNITGIPWYCRVSAPAGALDANGEPAAVPLPAGTQMLSRAFSSADAVADENGDKWLVLYLPENIRGEREEADKAASLNIPENALSVHIRTKYDGMEYNFLVYPGENVTNNFNVRRNCVYRVMVDVTGVTDQHNPSSNCFIVKPDSKVVFEPYNRVETGGGYRIGEYLNPDVEELRINSVEIIWQTKDCIGDNSDGSRVTFAPDAATPVHSKITVLTGREGNALVGARNAKGEIIWSWHIWVTPNEPDNLREAIVYKSYDWDEAGIKGGEVEYATRFGRPVDIESLVAHDDARIPGYGVMPCNLGAMAYRAGNAEVREGELFPEEQLRTFGMLYQWGRKDPFPPLTRLTSDVYDGGWLDYTNENAGIHYGNNNRDEVRKTSKADESCLFHSILKKNIATKKVQYAIAHPTVYIAGTNTLNNPRMGNPDNGNYSDNGNWCPDEADDGDRLWGGLVADNRMKHLQIDNTSAYLYDNYGTEKSIFDPCPSGWRVAPPDLWLGFTITGGNPELNNMAEVNYSEAESNRYGLSMYMRAWKNGPTSYFPTQGTITVNARGYHSGHCGNYHNATCDNADRVNILHIHNDNQISTLLAALGFQHFHIFELQFKNYYYKSTAGPVRCVRDAK